MKNILKIIKLCFFMMIYGLQFIILFHQKLYTKNVIKTFSFEDIVLEKKYHK